MTEPSQYFKGRTVQEQMNEVIGYVDTRAAEVATAAIASDVAQVHQDMLNADADAQAAAASAAAAAGTLANAVKKTGEASQNIAGDIAVAGDLTGGTVTVPTPVNDTDAASKKYVDDADALNVKITAINSYAVGLTGNQGPITGDKNFNRIIAGASSGAILRPLDLKNEIFPGATANPPQNSNTCLGFIASNSDLLGSIRFRADTSGNRQLWIDLTDVTGTTRSVLLMAVDVNGNIVKGWD